MIEQELEQIRLIGPAAISIGKAPAVGAGNQGFVPRKKAEAVLMSPAYTASKKFPLPHGRAAVVRVRSVS